MKKFIIAIILGLVSIMSYGQDWFNFNNNKNFSVSIGLSNVTPTYHTIINGGPIGTFKDTEYRDFSEYNFSFSEGTSINSVGVISMDLSVWGFYLSFDCTSSLSTGASSSASVDRRMDEGKCNVFHFGYKSPVTKWLYLYPIIGHVKMSTGYCNGMDYTINEHGIHNHYTPTCIFVDDFDYGGGIDIKLGHWFILSGKYTKYTYGVSIGFVFDFNYFMSCY